MLVLLFIKSLFAFEKWYIVAFYLSVGHIAFVPVFVHFLF